MLSTFVIGLREGLEAALIVGIVAAFLKQRGRHDLLRLVWLGVGLAALICLAVGLGLHAYSAELPQKQQEGLETVVGAVAVAMVTYMVIWMRRHSRELKKQLEGAAGSALESGSGWALVLMAFLAVFREGFETAVFLLAAFNEAANPVTAGRRGRARPARGRSRSVTASSAAACGSTCPSSSAPPAPCWCSWRPVWSSTPCTPPTRRAGSRRAGPDHQPELARAAGLGAVVAAHRHARLAAASRRHRAGRLAAVPDPGRPVRGVAARARAVPRGRACARPSVVVGAGVAAGTLLLVLAPSTAVDADLGRAGDGSATAAASVRHGQPRRFPARRRDLGRTAGPDLDAAALGQRHRGWAVGAELPASPVSPWPTRPGCRRGPASSQLAALGRRAAAAGHQRRVRAGDGAGPVRHHRAVSPRPWMPPPVGC